VRVQVCVLAVGAILFGGGCAGTRDDAADDDFAADDDADDDVTVDDDTTMADDDADECSETTGVDGAGLCATACGAEPPCEGLAPLTAFETCQGAGSHSVQDRCTETCQVEDQPEMLCRAEGVADCLGDAECEGVPAGTGDCDHDCNYVGIDCDAGGRITVAIDGITYFDRSTSEALLCRNLEFTTDQYGNGPPGAVVQVSTEAPGLFEAQLLGFEDDHANCEEKWGFVYLEGDCADVWLQKWNWNDCNTEYHTDLMKLETWLDTDGNCSYSDAENDEPYSTGGISWNPGYAYSLVITWE